MSLEVRGLCKAYGQVVVADRIDIDLPVGQCLGVIGPNGAGKSSLFHLLTGTVAADAGAIALDGKPLSGLPAHRRARLGVARAFQVPQPFGHLSVFQNALAAAAVLVYPLWTEPVGWMLLRVVTGMALVGLCTVIESWLNAQAAPEHRSRVFGVYMVVSLLALLPGWQSDPAPLNLVVSHRSQITSSLRALHQCLVEHCTDRMARYQALSQNSR